MSANGVFILARPFVDPESLRLYAAAFFAAQNRVPPPAR